MLYKFIFIFYYKIRNTIHKKYKGDIVYKLEDLGFYGYVADSRFHIVEVDDLKNVNI